MASESEDELIIAPGRGGLAGGLKECWQSRELLYFLAWRDIKVRYKQTVLGALWAVLQPLVTMLIFTLIFNRVGGIKPPLGIPYPIFAFAGLLPWMLFQSALVQSSGSIVASSHLLGKVYFPRMLVPLSSVVSALLDFFISFVVMIALALFYGYRGQSQIFKLGPGVFLVPVFILMAILSALAVGLWMAMLNAKYRDFRYVVPFMAQVWMFLSPVAYPSDEIARRMPAWVWWLYSLNPMVGVEDGFRWALFGQANISGQALIISSCAMLAVLVGGLFYFRREERVFVDLL
jgi:lipopolysaccharide transport system permease protein